MRRLSFINELYSNLEKIRENAPLIHNITNYVVMEHSANTLLSLGASPVMAHALEEVEQMVSYAGALVINIGTLDERWIGSMKKAVLKANELGTPVIFDPVGCGATELRTSTARDFLNNTKLNVIRGNASEVLSMLDLSMAQTKGVDSTDSSLKVFELIKENAVTENCVVVSGEVDVIMKGGKAILLSNGHYIMTKVTGMGCALTSVCGAFAAVEKDEFLASAHAMALYGVVGEMAAEICKGPGSFKTRFLDKLYSITKEEIESRLKVDFHEV